MMMMAWLVLMMGMMKMKKRIGQKQDALIGSHVKKKKRRRMTKNEKNEKRKKKRRRRRKKAMISKHGMAEWQGRRREARTARRVVFGRRGKGRDPGRAPRPLRSRRDGCQ